MAFHHGKGTHFELDNTSGTLTDISSWTDTADLARTLDTGETTTFGSDNRTFIVGLATATVSLGGKYDPAVAAVFDGGAEPASRTFEFGPMGDTSGNVRYTGECIVTGFNINNAFSDTATWSATMQITGAITKNTFP
ncbi:MAG: hypothetical protein OXH23_04245 [bacterium]|nr:hypothetical protein [bacterium]